MDEHEVLLKEHGRSLGEFLGRLVVPEAGLPRPIISLKGDMPVLLPVDQDTLRSLREFSLDHRKEFLAPVFVLHVQPFKDPYHRKTLTVEPPYAALTAGEAITRLDDTRPIVLSRLVVPDVPPEWRSLKPLELLLQALSKHVRHGNALGVGPTIPLRVPRQEILGKATGI